MIDGNIYDFRGTVSVVSADNPASAALGGFKQNASAFRFCLHCFGCEDVQQPLQTTNPRNHHLSIFDRTDFRVSFQCPPGWVSQDTSGQHKQLHQGSIWEGEEITDDKTSPTRLAQASLAAFGTWWRVGILRPRIESSEGRALIH